MDVHNDCSICMDAMCNEDVTHTKCLNKWTMNFNTNCPMCRSQIAVKKHVETESERQARWDEEDSRIQIIY